MAPPQRDFGRAPDVPSSPIGAFGALGARNAPILCQPPSAPFSPIGAFGALSARNAPNLCQPPSAPFSPIGALGALSARSAPIPAGAGHNAGGGGADGCEDGPVGLRGWPDEIDVPREVLSATDPGDRWSTVAELAGAWTAAR